MKNLKIIIRAVFSYGFPLVHRWHRFNLFTKRVLIIIIIFITILNMTDLYGLVMHCVSHILDIPILVLFVTSENDAFYCSFHLSSTLETLIRVIFKIHHPSIYPVSWINHIYDAEHQEIMMENVITIRWVLMCI